MERYLNKETNMKKLKILLALLTTLMISTGAMADGIQIDSRFDATAGVPGTFAPLTSDGIFTVNPDGTNEVFQVNDGTVDFTDGNAGVTGVLTIGVGGDWSYNKDIGTSNGKVFGTNYGSDGTISDADLLSIDDGATTTVAVGGGVGSPISWTTATGSGAPVRATSPTLVTPVLSGDMDGQGNYAVDLQNFPDIMANGPAYRFDLSNDSITAADNANHDVGLNDFTLEMDFKPGSITAANQFLINKEAGGIGYGLEQRLNDLWIRLDDNTTDVSAIIGTNVFLVGVNYPVVVTFDRSGNATAFINGDSVGTVDISSANLTLDNAGAFTIGTETGGTTKPFGGTVSKVRLHTTCLVKTDPEDESIINGGPVPFKYIGASQTELSTGNWLNAYGGPNWDTFVTTGPDNFTASDASGETKIRISVAVPASLGKRMKVSFTPTFSGATATHLLQSTSAYSGNGHIETPPSLVSGTPYSIEYDSTVVGTHVSMYFDVDAGGSFAITDFSVTQIGQVAGYEPSGFGHSQALDVSGNENHGTVTGPLLFGHPANHREKFIDLTVTGNGSTTLPQGYKITSIIAVETAGNALTGGLDVGLSTNGVEIVSGMAIGANAIVNCTLVATGVLGGTFTTADDTIYYSDGNDDANWDSAVIDITVSMERIEVN